MLKKGTKKLTYKDTNLKPTKNPTFAHNPPSLVTPKTRISVGPSTGNVGLSKSYPLSQIYDDDHKKDLGKPK